ncbi:MAG: damage-inducible mutagenesis protein [Pseudomonadota bacterium]|nr:damage-inducible mutagenesis protein [Pseudomonadota bacterium]
MCAHKKTALLTELRHQMQRLESGGLADARGVLPFGIPGLDDHLPTKGLALGALHEVRAEAELVHEAAASLFVAGILARLAGPVLWCLGKRDLFAPALANVGLGFERVIYTEVGDDKNILLIMEEGLRHAGLAGIVGEVSHLSTLASRRLHLAARQSGVTVFALHRARRFKKASVQEPSAAMTRWRIASIPSAALPVKGIGVGQWFIQLEYCRDAEPASWTLEACDASGRLALPSDMAHRPLAESRPTRASA